MRGRPRRKAQLLSYLFPLTFISRYTEALICFLVFGNDISNGVDDTSTHTHLEEKARVSGELEAV